MPAQCNTRDRSSSSLGSPLSIVAVDGITACGGGAYCNGGQNDVSPAGVLEADVSTQQRLCESSLQPSQCSMNDLASASSLGSSLGTEVDSGSDAQLDDVDAMRSIDELRDT